MSSAMAHMAVVATTAFRGRRRSAEVSRNETAFATTTISANAVSPAVPPSEPVASAIVQATGHSFRSHAAGRVRTADRSTMAKAYPNSSATPRFAVSDQASVTCRVQLPVAETPPSGNRWRLTATASRARPATALMNADTITSTVIHSQPGCLGDAATVGEENALADDSIFRIVGGSGPTRATPARFAAASVEPFRQPPGALAEGRERSLSGAQPLQQREQRPFDLGARGGRVGGVGDQHGGLNHRAHQHVRERLHLATAQHAAVHRLLQCHRHEPEPALRVDLAPLRPAEDGRRVEVRDADHGGIGAGVEERAHASRERLPRVGAAGRLLDDRGEQLVDDLQVNGAEEVALVLEVVVERATRDVRAADDLLRPDVRVAARGEQLARDAQQLGPRGDSLLLPWHTVCMLGHTTCM